MYHALKPPLFNNPILPHPYTVTKINVKAYKYLDPTSLALIPHFCSMVLVVKGAKRRAMNRVYLNIRGKRLLLHIGQ